MNFVAFIKKQTTQLYFLFIVSVLISSVIITYNKLFELGIEFYRHAYNSSLIYFCIFFIAISSWVCTKWSEGARGSGHDFGKIFIDEFENATSINDKSISAYISKYFSSKVVYIKIISSSFAAFGGAALGREGPLVHMSMAMLIYLKTKIKSLNISPANLLIIGTCVGFSAAFREPILGFIYIFEIFGFRRAFQNFWSNVIILLSTSYLSKFVLEKLLNVPPIIFNLPGNTASDISMFVQNTEFKEIFYIIIFISLISGIFGVVLQVARVHIHEYFKKSPSFCLFISPLAIGLLIISSAKIIGSDKILGPGEYLLQGILDVNYKSQWVDFLGKYVNSLLSLIVGCAGGVVIPSLALGAIFGDVVSGIFDVIPAFVILLSSASFLSSVIKAPLTSSGFIIIFTEIKFPMALYVIAASYLGYYCYIYIQRISNFLISFYAKK